MAAGDGTDNGLYRVAGFSGSGVFLQNQKDGSFLLFLKK